MIHPLRAIVSKPLAFWLVLALLARAMVPDGFMPGNGELVQLCTQQGVVQLQWDEASGDWLPHDPIDDHAPCDWSTTPTASFHWSAGFSLGSVSAGLVPTWTGTSATPCQRSLRPPARAPPRHV